MTVQSVPDARQELRERAQRRATDIIPLLHSALAPVLADAFLALLDEPTLLSLLGLRQVGWHPNQAPFNRFGLTRHRIFENDRPVYVKEAP